MVGMQGRSWVMTIMVVGIGKGSRVMVMDDDNCC